MYVAVVHAMVNRLDVIYVDILGLDIPVQIKMQTEKETKKQFKLMKFDEMICERNA